MYDMYVLDPMYLILRELGVDISVISIRDVGWLSKNILKYFRSAKDIILEYGEIESLINIHADH